MYPSIDMILHRERLLKDIQAKKRRVKEVADILSVKRETVSRWLARYRFAGLDGLCPKKPGPKRGSLAVNRTAKEIEDVVCLLGKLNPWEGPQSIADRLEEEYLVELHKTTVWRILKRRKIRYGRNHKSRTRKKKLYCLEEPGQEIQLDVVFPFGRARPERVYDAIDDCSRFVHAKLMPDHTQESAIKFVNSLILAMPFTIQAIRTDQGTEFGSKFTKHLQMLGIEHKKNPAYTPQYNGKIERYHRTFKEKECLFWNFKGTVDELNYRLKLWLNFYNFKKKHSGLHMNRLTPAQKILYASFQKPMQAHLHNVTGTLQLNRP